MSVIMTAGKKFATAQAKKKAKTLARVPSVSEEPRPPYSDETTSVWYWVLDGQVTTVMYNKTKKEVWCNGFLLDTYDGYYEGQEDEAGATDEGDVLDFTIFVPQTQISHQGRLIRLAAEEVRGVVTHQLLVDDWLIPEHVDESQQAYYEAEFQNE